MSKVSPKLAQWLVQYNQKKAALEKAGFKPTPVNIREGLSVLTHRMVTDWPQMSRVQDDMVTTSGYPVPVRIYNPDVHQRLPVLVYLHGGGHMAGSVTVYDAITRKLALAANHIVVSVEYRRAPECPYPAAVVDALNVVKHIHTTLDSRKMQYTLPVAIVGDSGGGALCATLAHLAQHDAGIRIRCQVLIYPSLDYTLQWPSVEENSIGYFLEKERIIWYFDHYFQNGENRKTASPLHMEFSANLPPTLVLTAGFCPLRDEGAAYVKKVASCDVYTEHVHYGDMIHAFLNMEDLVQDTCQSAYKRIAAFLNRSDTLYSS